MSNELPRKNHWICSTLMAALIISLTSGWKADASRCWAATKPVKECGSHAPIRDKWALLIGVDLLQDGTVPELKEAERDVKELAKVLRNTASGHFAPNHVKVITGPAATKSGIEAIVTDWLCKKVLPDDMALIYICSTSARSERGALLVYTYDTLSSEKDISAIDLETLTHDMKRRTQCKNLILALDLVPVKAGTGTNSVDGSFEPIARNGVTVLSAAGPNEISGNNGVLGTSFFVHHLGESLKHNAGSCTLKEAFAHINQTVSADSQTCFNRKQSPQFLPGADESYISNLALGMIVKSSIPQHGYSMGHPLDTLALNHPELTGPRGTLRPSVPTPTLTTRSAAINPLRPVSDGTAPAKAGQNGQKQKPANDEDDDEDDPPANIDYKDYMAKMKKDIQKHWTPPKGLESRKIVAMFTIARDGRILNPSIIEGSGVADLDKAAIDALHAASPLDPLPKGAPRSVDIKYSFDWHVQQN